MNEGGDNPESKTVFVAGASGTIGRAVVRALVADGHTVLAQRRASTPASTPITKLDAGTVPDEWTGAQIIACDLADTPALARAMDAHRPTVVISCIASRTGAPKDAMAVDYAANSALLEAAQAGGAQHFILLSAICVQRPKLAFQHAKLAFEKELIEARIDHTIVRPTAFFKSLSGQVARVAKGGKFMVFGDGNLTRCKPISDTDLARFIALCVTDLAKRGMTLPIGGPGPAISPHDQWEILRAIMDDGRPPIQRISPRWLTRIGAIFDTAARLSPLAREWLAEKAEYLKIAHYYATQSMLVLDPETGEYSAELTPEFGKDHLSDHYTDLIEAAR
ncbi:MAG: NAD(P)H-binding protein [Erythrobacter sp.]|nr:NAD(P)H-binding protein [Erythrobacter sp.]